MAARALLFRVCQSAGASSVGDLRISMRRNDTTFLQGSHKRYPELMKKSARHYEFLYARCVHVVYTIVFSEISDCFEAVKR